MARDGEARGPDAQKGTYGRIYDLALKRTEYAHRVVWRRVYGPIPRGLKRPADQLIMALGPQFYTARTRDHLRHLDP